MHEQPLDHTDHTTEVLNPRRALLAGIGGLAAGAFLAGHANAGPLNPPPGPITQTGRTTDEIFDRVTTEGRRGWIPVGPDTTPSSGFATYTISQPGNYYLTGPVSAGSKNTAIYMPTSDATLDLNGFTVSVNGGTTAQRGIYCQGIGQAIRNGSVIAENGAYALVVESLASTLEDLFITARSSGNGILLDTAITTAVRRVALWSGNQAGAAISSTPSSANVTLDRVVVGGLPWASGISVGNQSVLRECSVAPVSFSGGVSSNGITAGTRSTVSDCFVDGAVRVGISAGSECVIERCRSHNNSIGGFEAGQSSVIRDCYATAHFQTGRFGIRATGPAVQVLDNSLDSCNIGIDFRNVSGCVAFRNVCRTCPTGVAVNAGGNWYPFVDFSNVNNATNPLANLFT